MDGGHDELPPPPHADGAKRMTAKRTTAGIAAARLGDQDGWGMGQAHVWSSDAAAISAAAAAIAAEDAATSIAAIEEGDVDGGDRGSDDCDMPDGQEEPNDILFSKKGRGPFTDTAGCGLAVCGREDS